MRPDFLFMLRLICAVLNETELPKSFENINWHDIYSVSKVHGVTNIIGYAVMSGAYSMDDDTKKLFIQSVSHGIRLDAAQSMAQKEISEKFDEVGIDYMFLKGLNIKKLYPTVDMRTMSDCDILIKESQKDAILSLMQELGYEFRTESNHEFVFDKKPLVNIEFHKCMVPTYTEDLYEYYGDGWKTAKHEKGNKYALSSEDEFIYVLSHIIKHYRDAGIGIKHMLDVWVFLGKTENLDMEYIKDQLTRLGMYTFLENIIKLEKCWSGESEYDEISLEITEFVLKSGAYGSLKNKASATTIRTYMDKEVKSVSRYKYLAMIFPDYWQMKGIYPILEKRPYLLPFYWIKRLITGLLFKRKNIKYHVSKAQTVEDEYVILYKKHMDKVGLDIYNGRKKS